jgi:hypothetical protein
MRGKNNSFGGGSFVIYSQWTSYSFLERHFIGGYAISPRITIVL